MEQVLSAQALARAYDVEVHGEGPLVLCVPGMGESRASFRHLTPGLVRAGFRVAVMDLRGHGESSVKFTAYDDDAAASDILAVFDQLGAKRGTVIGNSMGAAAGVLAAAKSPTAVERLILIGPFVRDHGSAATRLLLKILLMRPWGHLVWGAYFKSLFGKPLPADQSEHMSRALDLLKRPGRWHAFQATTRTSHASAEAALSHVHAQTIVIMGEKDPDFPNPAAEAQWIAEELRGQYQMIPGAGHYPTGEQPTKVLDAILPFLSSEIAHG